MTVAERRDGMATSNLDTCLRLVADNRRRKLIQQLRQETDRQKSIDELATQLRQEDSLSEHGRAPSREQVSIQLHHTQLPKLADNDVIEYDRESKTVRYQPHETIESILDALPEELSQANP